MGRGWAGRHPRLLSWLVMLVTVLSTLLVAEAILDRFDSRTSAQHFKTTEQKRAAYFRELGLPFDTRSRYHFVSDLRDEGQAVYPYVFPSNFLRRPLTVDGKSRFPLSGISRVDTAYCNEGGEYLVYRSDERGFNNPPGLWDGDRLDVVFAGDSYTHGACVRPGEAFADVVRTRFPRTLNLGSGGNGPLMELASIREHLRDRRFSHLVWTFCGNDLGNLDREFQQPILRRYLDDHRFFQDIAGQQPELDRRMAELVDGQIDRYGLLFSVRDFFVQCFPNMIGLVGRVFRSREGAADPEAREQRLVRFEQVMREAKRFTEQQGARLLFLFIPTFFVDFGEQTLIDATENRERVLGIVEDLGLEAVDLTDPLQSRGGPEAIYHHGFPGHFDAAGYAVIAEQVLQRIDGPQSDATGDAAPRCRSGEAGGGDTSSEATAPAAPRG